MSELPRFRSTDLLLLLVVLAAAGGSRAWYLVICADSGRAPAPLKVQDPGPRPDYPEGTRLWGHTQPTELDALVNNLLEHRWYGSLAPLADEEEKTAHQAPGYPWLVFLVARWLEDPAWVVCWAQCVLGVLTAACYFFFARRAFRSSLVGFLAGLLAAIHPFWIINTAELSDGVVVTFLLAAIFALGTRGSQEGGAITSLFFGLGLAGLAMMRATLLPFTLVAMLWYLLRCRALAKGWFGALLAFLGFANGLAPWAVRNFQVYAQPVPVSDSTFWHLWVGNNPLASGGPLDEKTVRAALDSERLEKLRSEPNQARRYGLLGNDVLDEVKRDPAGTLRRRLWAGLYFVFGQAWFKDNALSLPGEPDPSRPALPPWLEQTYQGFLTGSLLGMLLLGLIGWRWSYAWRRESRLATLAVLWVPLPYLLGHAQLLSGPRLPLDGIFLCYGALVLACLAGHRCRRLAEAPQT